MHDLQCSATTTACQYPAHGLYSSLQPAIAFAGANLNGTLPQNLFAGLPDLQQLNIESNPSEPDLTWRGSQGLHGLVAVCLTPADTDKGSVCKTHVQAGR